MLTALAEHGLPDWMIRAGIRRLLRTTLRQESTRRSDDFVAQLGDAPIALAADDANRQHYEVPAEFFETILGPRLKYSCCWYDDGLTTLADAEKAMLRLTCERAEIVDGMDVLDLGCGWGSLSLWIAERYPRCRVTALSNSAVQRRFIELRCREQGIGNLSVITANVADYTPAEKFDRVVSVEMFEHMRNYRLLLSKVAAWLRPEGRLFVHLFCHRELCYPFKADSGSWMARNFFTGGIMPSFDLLSKFDCDLVVRRRWAISGRHYARTCEDWLLNLDEHRDGLLALFAGNVGRRQSKIILQRWRMFLMACAELFAYACGDEWLVGHYLLEPAKQVYE